MDNAYADNTRKRMEKAFTAYEDTLKLIRSGRANAGALDPVMVSYYGVPTPLNQIAGISVVEGKQLLIRPFDPTSLKDIEKAIFEANINLTPLNDGTVIRINVPALTEETRKDLVKKVNKEAEEAKVNIRNIRRDENDKAKKAEDLSEDREKDVLDQIQKLTDEYIKKIDEAAKVKGKEIMTV